jgi:hypothetical protein
MIPRIAWESCEKEKEGMRRRGHKIGSVKRLRLIYDFLNGWTGFSDGIFSAAVFDRKKKFFERRRF